jgi:hypothetical protein
MTKSFLHLVLCLPLLGMLANAADISVRIIDPHHAPIQGATISLISRNGGGNWNLTTDVNGSCRFNGVAGGRYLVQGEAPGFDPSLPQVL